MADLTLKDLASQQGYNVSYDNKSKMINIANPTTGKSVDVQHGYGDDYGLGWKINGSSYVTDSNKLINALSENPVYKPDRNNLGGDNDKYARWGIGLLDTNVYDNPKWMDTIMNKNLSGTTSQSINTTSSNPQSIASALNVSGSGTPSNNVNNTNTLNINDATNTYKTSSSNPSSNNINGTSSSNSANISSLLNSLKSSNSTNNVNTNNYNPSTNVDKNYDTTTSAGRADYLNSLLNNQQSGNNYYNNLTSNGDLRTQRQAQLDEMYNNLQQSQLTGALLGRQQQEQTYNQQKGDINLDYENLLGQLNQEKNQATPQYQDMKNQQFKTTLNDIQKINESMAGRGQYFGGTNEQVQSDQKVANENAMNQIGLQEQQLYDDINRRATESYKAKENEIRKIDQNIQLMKDQGASADSALIQGLQAQKMQATIDLENVLNNRELQIAQLQQDAEQNRVGNILSIVGQQEGMSQNALNNSYNMAELFGRYLTPDQLAEAGNDIQGYLQKNGVDTLAGLSAKEDIKSKQTNNLYLARQLEANLKTSELQNVGQDIANQISKVNLNYLPQEKQLAIQTAQVQLQNGELQNAYQTIVNSNLDAKTLAEIDNIYSSTEQNRAQTGAITAKATGSGATSPTAGKLTSQWGESRSGGSRQHAGVDYGVPKGTAVQTVYGGKVTRVAYDEGGYGHYIDVYNESTGLTERFAHLSSVGYKVGDSVGKGTVIAKSGDSGSPGSYHLHYEIRTDKGGFGYKGSVDPLKYVK